MSHGRRYYVLQWQTPIMPAPSFWYYASKQRRNKAAAQMRKNPSTVVVLRSGVVNPKNAILNAMLDSEEEQAHRRRHLVIDE